jgi:hypothetical protein
LLLPVVARSAAPDAGSWTNSQVAASRLLAALQSAFREMENRKRRVIHTCGVQARNCKGAGLCPTGDSLPIIEKCVKPRNKKYFAFTET